ncbi:MULTISPECIES: LapA family protein [Ignavibacterium]|jgi:multisubunit Na+/H+ antiporter MnhC subunit|uniref:LapA family protein n=1 Tax=Ignavibacterium TaxID=795750 RepID=UPI0025BFFFD9|nr:MULTISPECIES: LapA family protein [Ignavibacterium]MBI5662453.1 LapA family protein [Ignavibacterium album]
MRTKIIILLVLIGMFILFVIQNIEVVIIHFLFFSFAVSQVLLLFIVFAVGVIVGLMLPGTLDNKKKLDKVEGK